ncbi:response regulator transcription factor [Fusobacterium sp. PH5-44]|uniref:response regulator transcription factor n=1 Tax=unclassified Fusobacterium TaxID=2648384 RepID=UPI003D214A02
MKKILVIEDDKKIRRLLQLELEHEGYSVDFAEDGERALEKFQNNFYNIILLDLMIPKFSGEEVCKKIRENSEVPIIVITAKDQTLSKIQLLDMGADDYLTKPFEMGELFARIRVLFRNKSDFINKDFLSYENLKLDKKRKILFRENEEITLTKTEYNLMEYFIINKEIVSSREKILNEIWGYDYDGEDKIVDVYINALRKKIDNSESKYIHTLRGFGYVLKYETKEVKK